ncbi:MAG TPA: zinc ribbon domain-containing protein [Candidatus Limnocylindrales bacterium]|nr:zinc ribbon domain-containing protein [Candidatus Limnocylindrales bacterium]
MPEILTESFCERCGTRYTFESAAPKKAKRLGQFKTLSKGMKNWVMSDDTSLDEAMAAARSDEERAVTSQQLDAFHSTFNFCMNCRQYTCANCWNGAEGRCLTCAPHLGHEILAAPFPEAGGFEPARIEAEAWPEIDLGAVGANGNGHGHGNGNAIDNGWADATEPGVAEIDPAARLAFLSGEAPAPTLPPEPTWPVQPAASAVPEPADDGPSTDLPAWASLTPEHPDLTAQPEAGVEPVAEAAVIDEPAAPDMAAAAAAADAAQTAAPVAADALPPTVEGRAATGANRTSDLLRRFRPGQSLDDELAAYEAELERQEAADRGLPEPNAVAPQAEAVAAAPEPAPIAAAAEPAPEPIGAAAEQAPEPVVLAPEPEPVPVVAPEPVAAELEPVALAPEPDPAADPEPVAAGPEREVAPEPAAEPAAAAPEPTPAAEPTPVREDRIEQPTWRIFAPDGSQPDPTVPPAAPGPVQPPALANGNAAPQWPTRTEPLDSPAMALLANRGNGAVNAGLWAASSQEVLAQPGGGDRSVASGGVQPCSNCGLSLSATARFCRRCGTRQA